MEIEERPWGTYQVLHNNNSIDGSFKVKKIVVNPDEQLSVQRHVHRDEVWTIIEGTGEVLHGPEDDIKWEVAVPGMVFRIPKRQIHSVKASKNSKLVFVEVQLGSYLEEDDIERISDKYGRV